MKNFRTPRKWEDADIKPSMDPMYLISKRRWYQRHDVRELALYIGMVALAVIGLLIIANSIIANS